VKGEHAGIAADPNPETHRVVRKMLAPAFSRRALKEQEPAVHQHIDRLIEKLVLESKDGADMREVWPYYQSNDSIHALITGYRAVMMLIDSSVV
jgi:hypothetical protein